MDDKILKGLGEIIMVMKNILEFEATGVILEAIEIISVGIELLAVLIILTAVLISLFRYLISRFQSVAEEDRYQEFRHGLARSLLLGLELLIAADVIRTVALEATFESVIVLGLLVIIRTFLSWTLTVEIEGYWPWRKPPTDERPNV
jgi:uncharacterized membrane protein